MMSMSTMTAPIEEEEKATRMPMQKQ